MPDGVSSGRLHIRMAFRAKTGLPTEIEIPSDLISDLNVEGPQADLKKDQSGRTMVTVFKPGLVNLTYTLRNGWDGPLVHPHQFQPVILSQYMEITGDKALVWLKRDEQEQVVTNFDWQALPPSWALATSFGVASPTVLTQGDQSMAAVQDRCQTYLGSWFDVNQALFAAGDFRFRTFKIGGRTGVLAVRGVWVFSDEEAADEIGRTIGLVRNFWRDDAFPYYLVTLQPFDQDHGSSDGTAYTDAFWMYVSRKDNINGLLNQLAHESFHAWNPLKMGYLSSTEFAKVKWFKEGFTDYYAERLTYEGGERSAQMVVASANRDLLAFPSSSSEYVRGFVIALWLDAAIREQSHGQHSLDDVMYRMVKDRGKALTEERIYATVAPYVSVGTLTILKQAADQGGSLSAPAAIPWLGGCYRASYGKVPTFDLGFDFGRSRATKLISGVNPIGPAYKAGLRDGQVVATWDIERGNTEKLAEVIVRVEGQERKISFSPVGEPTPAWQYVPDSTVVCSAHE